jgi:hypothetical protein
MYWGAGPDLGLLTVLGYLFFVAGAASMWRAREVVFFWIYSEARVTRRNLSRHTPIGPFYSPREQSRLKILLNCFSDSLDRMPWSSMFRSAVLMAIAALLVSLDFFF